VADSYYNFIATDGTYYYVGSPVNNKIFKLQPVTTISSGTISVEQLSVSSISVSSTSPQYGTEPYSYQWLIKQNDPWDWAYTPLTSISGIIENLSLGVLYKVRLMYVSSDGSKSLSDIVEITLTDQSDSAKTTGFFMCE
jgi:hypothetical protein